MRPCVAKLVILVLFTSLVEGSGIYHEILTSQNCPSKDFSCCSISNCQAVWSLLRNGRPPKACGWLHRTPLVCCPQHINQEDHYVHQTSHYLEEEPQYVPQKHLYNLRPPSVGEEEFPIHKATPSIIEISPSIREDLPIVEYLPPSVILPVVEHLPSSERIPPVRYLPPNERTLPSRRYFTSGGKRLPYTNNLSSGVRWRPSSGNLPSKEKRLPSTGPLPFNGRSLPPRNNETPSTERLPTLSDDTPSATDLPPSGTGISPSREETFLSDVEIPSSERRQPPGVESLDYVDTSRPQATQERKPLKLGSGSSVCGRRRLDRSSNIPESRLHTDTNSSETTTSAPEEEEGIFEISIVGGARTNDKWTWMAGIFARNATRPFCGGTVIDSKHIVTAAHCFLQRGIEPTQYTVKVGQIDLSDPNPSFDIQEIKIHENYQSGFNYGDIAILRLNENLPFGTLPVCLPEEDNLSHGDNVTVLGWGQLSFGGRSSDALQQADGIPIVRNKDCNAKYANISRSPFPDGITENIICAGSEEGEIDACRGDSGGPLLREFSKDRWALVGIVSFGFRCAEPGFPGVYTRVASYAPWITEYLDELNK